MNKIIFDRIVTTVCYDYDITVEQLQNRDNSGRFVYPRQLIIYLANKHNIGTHTEIGQFFKRDHSTVTHSIYVINNYIETDPIKRKQIESYHTKIKAALETKSLLDLYRNDIDELQKDLTVLEFRYINVKERLNKLIEEMKLLNL